MKTNSVRKQKREILFNKSQPLSNTNSQLLYNCETEKLHSFFCLKKSKDEESHG